MITSQITTLDTRDAAILAERVTTLDKQTGPRVGDYVRFADGTVRRISYDWGDSLQTSAGGSYYLGNGYVSMSGSLYSGVPAETLTDTGERKDGRVWFFHHDYHTAGGGIDVVTSFRVYACTLEATS